MFKAFDVSITKPLKVEGRRVLARDVTVVRHSDGDRIQGIHRVVCYLDRDIKFAVTCRRKTFDKFGMNLDDLMENWVRVSFNDPDTGETLLEVDGEIVEATYALRS